MATKKLKISPALLSLPDIDYDGKDARTVARLVAHLCRFPDAKTVEQFKKAVFPTKRKTTDRGKLIYAGNKPLGMYDDNTTPRWALLWSHGIRCGGGNDSLRGWRVAHVWNNCNNLDCYTRLENLLLVPAAYAGLTDDEGPLAPYLRYHAHDAYEEWCPECKQMPKKPDDYDAFSSAWQYLPAAPAEHGNSRDLVVTRLKGSRSGRAKVLRKFIGDINYWDQPSGKA
jgi:hypothetical protein